MRIALLAPLVSAISEPFLGGAQAMLADLARGLQQRGHEVTLFARQGSSVADVRIEAIDVPESVRPANFSRPADAQTPDPGFFDQANLFLDLCLRLQQRSQEFDLFHAHAFDWPIFALGPLLGKPLIHTIHLPAISPEINAGLKILHEQGHRTTLVTVSQACARTYLPYTPMDAVIYNGLDFSAIPFTSEVTSDAPLLFAGRITPEKGLEAAIEIAARSGKRLLIAGGIYDQRYFKDKIEARLRQSSDHTQYLGLLERQQLWQIMSHSLGLLCPIEWDEPFGLTQVEALATGTPVIAYRRGALDEIIQHEQTGFLIPPGARLEAALAVEQLPHISRSACRASVDPRFSLEKMLLAYEQLYFEVSQTKH
ncbi:MAG TPA: glycosyltransferase [Ktedonobacteraceae bacterium]|nr:glycosyltransferase [Ktedonobacteraceae bacterium]